MKGDVDELNHLKGILNNFAEALGLKVNYEKSMMVPINISEERLDMLAGSLFDMVPAFYILGPSFEFV